MKAAAVFLLLFLLLPATAGAQDPPPTAGELPRFQLGVEAWFVDGDQVLSGGPVYAANRFELAHPVDGVLLSAVAMARLREPWRLRAAVGRNHRDTGVLTDTDWDGRGRLWYLSTSTSEGDTLSVEAELFYRLLGRSSGSHLDLSVGYRFMENKASFHDAHLLLDDYVPIFRQTEGVWNDNEILLSGVCLGVRAAWVLSGSLSVNASVGYIPYLWGRYRAARYAGTLYEQIESVDPTGQGIDLAAALSWRLFPRALLDVGYRIRCWRAEGDENPESSFFGIHNDFAIDMRGAFVRVKVVF
ncbi:MAG: hypothetical protein LJE65_01460 [Desulfobacteraceae bacterium]|jgi:hypothetical protein|nr:hypothetical protein [Desulfobacteraceae bacterium]